MSPRLVSTHVPASPTGVVLVMHGGAQARGRRERVSPTQLSVLRMVPIALRIAALGLTDLAVFRLLNTHRGWDSVHTPVHDAHLALAEIEDRLGALPVSLVGHSLGARAALLSGSSPRVVSITALNAYLYPRDAEVDLSGRSLRFIHGDQDRIAPPQIAEGVATRLARVADVEFVRVRGGKHAMLARHRTFDGLAAGFAVQAQRTGPGERSSGLQVRTA